MRFGVLKTLRGRLDLAEVGALRRRFARYLRPHGLALALALSAGLGATVMEIAGPWPIKLLFDLVLTDAMGGTAVGRLFHELAPTPTQALVVLCGAILLIALAESLFCYARDILLGRTGQDVVGKVRQSLFRHMQRLSPDVFERRRTGDLLMRLTGDMHMLRQMLVDIWVTASQNLLTIVLMIAVMFYLNPLLAVIAVASLPLMAWSSALISRRLRQVAQAQREKESHVASVAHEVLGAMMIVQAFNRENIEARRFARHDRSSIRAGLKATRLEARLFRIISLATAVTTCAVLFFGVRAVLAQTMTSGDLLLFVAYVRALNKPLRKMSRLAGQAAKATACSTRISEILEIPPTVQDREDARVATGLTGDIALRGLSFDYPDGTPALRDLDLHIPARHRVAIVGHSGAGKSTLVKLLLRFYDPTQGGVSVDGTDIRDFTLSSLREHIGFVQQETVLFGLTVAENIGLGLEDLDREAIKRAACAVGADSFIEALPEGYDTLLSDRGTTLSGGQRQRLALARALLRDAPILILDEPISGLDAEVARVAEEAWLGDARKRTVLVICHHFLCMERYDAVVFLQGGRLADMGTHQQLLQRCAAYERLYTSWLQGGVPAQGSERPCHAHELQRLAC